MTAADSAKETFRHPESTDHREAKHQDTAERTIAWLSGFRRLVIRYERKVKMFRAFVHLACMLITLRQF